MFYGNSMVEWVLEQYMRIHANLLDKGKISTWLEKVVRDSHPCVQMEVINAIAHLRQGGKI